MTLRSLIRALPLFLVLPAGIVRAAEPGPFVAAVSAAYPQLKMSWFYCRTGNDVLAGDELDSFIAAWRKIDARFRSAPPQPFARDKGWTASLDRIGKDLGHAADAIRAGRAKDAIAPLGDVRRELGAMRRRNGIVIFSDYVDAYGAVVDRLAALRQRTRKEHSLSDADIDVYAGLARDLRAAVETLRARAPDALKNDPGFTGSVEGNLASIAKLDRGIRDRHAKAIHGSVSSVRADFVLLFTRYG